MVGQWSREDLLRAFDLLTKAEQEIRSSDQPRYNLEMALLRLMHLRKLVPLSDLLSGRLARYAAAPQVPMRAIRCQVCRSVQSVPKAVPTGASAGTAHRGTVARPRHRRHPRHRLAADGAL